MQVIHFILVVLAILTGYIAIVDVCVAYKRNIETGWGFPIASAILWALIVVIKW